MSTSHSSNVSNAGKSRPEDVPKDVWGKSMETTFHMLRDGGSIPLSAVSDLARAIMAAKAEEREACAQVADLYTDNVDIAHFIRKRGEG